MEDRHQGVSALLSVQRQSPLIGHSFPYGECIFIVENCLSVVYR